MSTRSTRDQRVFIDMDGVIVDFEAHMKQTGMTADEVKRYSGAYLAMPAMPGALAAVRSIIGAGYEVWIATKPPTGIPFAYGDKAAWVMRHLPELTQRIIVTHHKGMLGRPGDWLIDDRPHKAHCDEFEGWLIPFGGTTGTGWPEALALLGIGKGMATS
jgi:5'(3')-deoxyribonucleotidase